MSSHGHDSRRQRELETELAAAITRQGEVFSGAIALIERIQTQEDLKDPSSQSAITLLQSSLDQIIVAQRRVADCHQRLQKSGLPMSDGMQQTLSEQEQVLRNLLTAIDQLQNSFQLARQELVPQLDSETKRRTMQSAYQQSLRTA